MPAPNTAAVVAQQSALKAQLRAALAEEDDEGCWARITAAQTPADIAKLVAVNGSYYAFLSHGRRYDTLKAATYLVHEDEFVVHWARSGPNNVECVMTGECLEASFFMYSVCE